MLGIIVLFLLLGNCFLVQLESTLKIEKIETIGRDT